MEFFTFQKYQILSYLAVLLAYNIYNRQSRHYQVKTYFAPSISQLRYFFNIKNFKHWYKRYQEYIQHFLKLIKLGVVLQHSFPAFIKLVWSTLLIIGLSIMTFLVMFWPEQNTFLKIMSFEELHSIK